MTAAVPARHAEFLRHATDRLREDPRLVGLAAGGSYLTHTMDEYSDVDLVVAVEPDAYRAVLDERQAIAASLGPLLAASPASTWASRASSSACMARPSCTWT